MKKAKRQRSTVSKVGCLCAIVVVGTAVPFFLTLQLASLSPYLPFFVIVPALLIGIAVAFFGFVGGTKNKRSKSAQISWTWGPFVPFGFALAGGVIGAALADQQISESGDKLNVHPH